MQKQDIDELRASLSEKQEALAAEAEKGEVLASEETDMQSMGPLMELPPLMVNLKGLDGSDRLLKTTLSLELDSEETRREAESLQIKISYNLRKLLSGLRPDDLVGDEQMELVRKNLRRRADAVLASKKGQVKNVWPTEWIVE